MQRRWIVIHGDIEEVFVRKFTFDSVTDCEKIHTSGETVIFAGKHPWIFRKDGSYIAKIKGVRNAWQMYFLPNDIVFMDGSADKSYHFVSTQTGEIYWSLPKKGRRDLLLDSIAASPNGQTVYYFYSIHEDFYVDTIVLDRRLCTSKRLPVECAYVGGPIGSAYCDEEGNLSLLQEVPLSQGTLRLYKLEPDTLDILSCKEFHCTAKDFAIQSNDEYILFANLKVFSIQAGEMFDLLENEQKKIQTPGCRFVVDQYDKEHKLLTTHCPGNGSTLIIDCDKRSIAAHYRPISYSLHSGALVENEFWIGSSDGIVKRPFPHMDPFPRNFLLDK